jgi:hypothetical protein
MSEQSKNFTEQWKQNRFDVHCFAVVIILANDTTGTYHPISPWFKTIEEARSFQQKVIHRFPKCRINEQCFAADNEEQRQELIADIFGAEYQEMITGIFGTK